MFTLMYNCPRLSENNGHRFQNCSSCVGCITFSLAMGNAVKHFQSRGNVPDKDTEDRKRKRDTSSDLDSCSSLQSLLHTPKRKKTKSTAKYIYQTLFLDGEDSDVTLEVCGKEWKLHKLYLRQSPYFASMFGGCWKETEMSTVKIDIIDENITQESLKIAFGSLYHDDVFIKPVQLVSVVATATLLQLDGLLQHCSTMMKDTLGPDTVIEYHTVSRMYGLEETRVLTMQWFTRNLLVTKNLGFIKNIGIDLMTEIVASPDFFVMQVEVDIYTLLKKWIFLINNPDWSESIENGNLLKATDTFLQSKLEDGQCYLETKEGQEYIPVFSRIRWHHVVNDMSSIKVLENDRIMPMSWLEPMFLYGWRKVLAVEQGLDKGPSEKLSAEVFNDQCSRCGRVLPKSGDYCWRWVGYSYGVDLLVCINNGRLVSVKRNTYTQSCPQAVSLADHRHIAYRMTVTSIDGDGREKAKETTGIKHVCLGKDEEDIALVLDKEMEYPLVLSMNVVYITPSQECQLPQLKVPDR